MKLKDYLPQKAVANDLCVSLPTLWRARNSNLPGFPAPIIIGGKVYWKTSELALLEDALLQFKGRCVFEKGRAQAKKLAALTKAKAARKHKPLDLRARDQAQQDLF